ncbi:MAG: flagellin [Vampirovibrionales bacterium]|nr:flagellin [Vampirovibrionales bacterium]
MAETVFNTNPTVLRALSSLQTHTNALENSLERIASGKRINSAADDPTGLSLSSKLTSQVRKQMVSLQNAQDGISLLQVTEGALGNIGDSLLRIRELTVQMASDTNSQTQRNVMAQEVRNLIDNIDRTAQVSKFNGVSLLDGSANGILIQVGPQSSLASNTIDLTPALASVRVDAGDVNGGLGLIDSSVAASATFASLDALFDPATGSSSGFVNTDAARNFMADIDGAILQLNNQRALIGTLQNQLETTISNLSFSNENLQASNSRILDLDVAAESSRMIQAQILQQAAATILTQANQTPDLINALLQNR